MIPMLHSLLTEIVLYNGKPRSLGAADLQLAIAAPQPNRSHPYQSPTETCTSAQDHDLLPPRCLSKVQLAEQQLKICGLALDAIDQGILVIDCRADRYPIVFVSRGFERLTGYTADEVIGQSGAMLDDLVADREAAEHLRKAIFEQRHCAIEILNHRKDGTSFWNELTLTPIVNSEGMLTHFVSVSKDITQRHLLEEKLRRSQKLDAVGRLAGGIAHDFNNILALILGYADNLLQLPELHGESHESVAEIYAAARRGATLTRQLLTFSRNEFVEPRILDLNSIVTGIRSILYRVMGESVDIQTSIASEAWPVKTDQTHFEQAIINLAMNARDAMPQGGTLYVAIDNLELLWGDRRLATDMAPGRYVCLSVRDTGTGMTQDLMANILEPFYTTKEPGKGTGLGLPFVYGIVKQSEGHLTIESTPGSGSTFAIYLPTAYGPQASREPDPSESRDLRGSERILLVEDQPKLREYLVKKLGSAGYDVLEASDGSEALELVASTHPPIDLVLTDIVMPQMNGASLLEALRTTHADLSAIFMSGYGDDTLVQFGIHESEAQVLRKPFLPVELLSKVRATLDRKRS